MASQVDDSSLNGTAQVAYDTITAGPLDRLSATLDRDDPGFLDGDAIPPLAHWLFFLPSDRQSKLDADGHPERGDFLPAAPDLPRRMWAGSRIDFLGAIRVGMRLRRTSRIVSVKDKQGANGPLLFVTVRHEIGEPDGDTLLVDEHDIVYRSAETIAGKPGTEVAAPGPWRRSLVPDERLLFRYSALTFNAHRIHYDSEYVTRVEGYPGLVVHGPLVATLMMDLLRRQIPEADVASYSFRARSPLFAGNALHLDGIYEPSNGTVELWTSNAEGGVAMTAQAVLKAGTRGGKP
jgi:3-methylfumaryl-CoA hydratase